MGTELSQIGPGPERERWVPLLELADEPAPLRAYLDEGDLYGLVGEDRSPRAVILVIYQRLGFRLTYVERDYFNAEKGYPDGLEENGIPIRDMVWMDLDLAPFSLA